MSLLDNASLLLTPNAYKEGKLYSVIPSNGNGDFTATRATTATRVNSAGLVDLVPYNLVQYSEQFENSAWTKTDTTITANTTIAPNGTLTADTMNVTGSSSRVIASPSVTAGTYTLSVWMKILSGSGTMRFNIFLDGTGTSSIFLPTSEWQRFTYTFTAASSASNLSFRGQTFVGDVAIWGAQLVEGTSARDYLRTETRLNIPRVDYSLGGCPNILLEPQRTNLALQSSSFDSVSWGKISSSVTANTTTSPSGIADADTLIENNANAAHLARQTITSSGTSFTLSVYAKAKERSKIMLFIPGASSKGYGFDLANGTMSAVTGVTAADSFSITNVGNGWYRCSIVVNTATISAVEIYPLQSFSNYVYLGDGTSGVFLWGAQLEAGAYSTSFIPTTTASVTRNADSITRNNIFTNGLITAAGGTWFVEFRNNVPLIRQTNGGLLFLDASSNNYFNFYHPPSSSRILIAKAIGGTFSNIYTTTTNTAKIAIKWNGSTADVFVNGAKVVSATAFTATALENLSCNGASNPFNINEMALFPTPLTDAQCLALTA